MFISSPPSSHFFEEALAAVGVGCWVWDSTSGKFSVSTNFHQLLGHPADNLPQDEAAWLAATHSQERPLLDELFSALSSDNPPTPRLALRLRHSSGMWLWFDVHTRCLPDSAGWLVTFQNITQQKQSEAALRDSQLRYRALYSTSPLAFILWDKQGHISEWNRRAESLFGWSTMEVIGKTVHRLVLPEDQHSIFQSTINALIHNTGDGNFSGPALSKTGPLHQCNWHNVALRAPNGSLLGILSLIQDVSLERLAQQNVERDERIYRSLVETSPDGIMLLELDGKLQTANQQAHLLFDIDSMDDIADLNIRQFSSTDDNICQLSELINASSDYVGLIVHRTLPLVRLNGLKFDAAVAFTTITDSQNNPSGIVLFIRDITDSLRAERELANHHQNLERLVRERTAELELARGAAENATKVKAEFLANMSHEIRTPINAVIGLTHLMLKTELSNKQSDYTSRISSAGKMLLGLINDILDFSKIEAGQMSIETAEFSLNDVLENVTTLTQTRAQEKGLELHYIVEPDVPQNFIGDPLRISQILVNLVSNAIKFTSRGSVSVSINTKSVSKSEICLEIAVEDTGIGITQEQQSRLFQAFTQADASISRKYGGTGLGLTICKRLTELMGGNISVTSQPDIGSRFVLDICLGVSTSPAIPVKTTKNHILIVDDNILARSVLAKMFEKLGCSCTIVASGEEALKLLDSHSQEAFDIVSIDLNMPEMNGIELAEAIIKQVTPCPRLFLVTATNTHTIEESGHFNKFSAVIHKPVIFQQLADLINQESIHHTKATSTPPAPLANTCILLVEDVPTNQLIAREMLEILGATVEVADNGRVALEAMASSGERYHLVLMDMQMPEMGGVEATQLLRASGRWPNLPIIAMTANAMDEEKQRCLNAGMNDFLTKPIDPERLAKTIQHWTSKNSRLTEPLAPPRSPPLAPNGSIPELPGIDTVDGLARMMNKPKLYEKILCEFHNRFCEETARIRADIATGNFDTAERRAHSTKGLSGSIGALSLMAIAGALEASLHACHAPSEEILQTFENELNIVVEGIRAGFGLSTPNTN